MRTVGLVLAGGESRRMGVDKLHLPRGVNDGTETVLSHVIDVVMDVCDGVIVLTSVGSHQRMQWLTEKGATIVADDDAYQGPLSALAKGWRYTSGYDAVTVVAGDLIDLQQKVLRDIHDAFAAADASTDAVVALRENKIQPLLACYRPSVGAVFQSTSASGRVNLMAATDQLQIAKLSPVEFGWHDWWTRPVHTRADYEAWLAAGGANDET